MGSNIVVLGNGFLGKEYKRHGFTVWGRDKFDVEYHNKIVPRYQLDRLSDFDVVINCIGTANTRWCEDRSNFDHALFINGMLPSVISKFCKRKGIKFVQISTGCLYDDTIENNKENSYITAHCNYTVTKWVGEQGCNETDLILRPRLYFSDIPNKNNLFSKLPNFKSYVRDKVDSLTCTSTIVGATKALLDANQCGIFNVAQQGTASIYEIAKWCKLDNITETTSDSLRSRENLYLVNNTMDITKLLKYYKPTDIKTAIQLSYSELKNNEKHNN